MARATEMFTQKDIDALRAADREYARNQKLEKPLDGLGRELPDPTPMEPPLNYKRTPSLNEQIRDMIRSERLRQEVEAQGFETFEEADDFEMAEDPEPWAPYEEQFEPTPMQELHRRRRQATADAAAETASPPGQKNNLSGDQPDPVTEPAKPAKSGPKATQNHVDNPAS